MNMATVGDAPDLHVHYIDAIGAVVKYLFVSKFGEDNPNVGDDLDTTMVEAPGLAQNVVNRYISSSKKWSSYSPTLFPIPNPSAISYQDMHTHLVP